MLMFTVGFDISPSSKQRDGELLDKWFLIKSIMHILKFEQQIYKKFYLKIKISDPNMFYIGQAGLSYASSVNTNRYDTLHYMPIHSAT
jgi:hypothetical protein